MEWLENALQSKGGIYGAIGGLSGYFSLDIMIAQSVVLNYKEAIVYNTFKFGFGLISAILFALAGKITQDEYDKYKKRKKGR